VPASQEGLKSEIYVITAGQYKLERRIIDISDKELERHHGNG
jgi:hypothetical protein